MPPLEELINSPMRHRQWTQTEPLASLQANHPMPSPVADPYRPTPGLRCPLPPINPVSVDNLRQLDQPGVRSVRVIPPKYQSS